MSGPVLPCTMAGDQTLSVIRTSDASGGWGCGAFYEEHWFQLAWKDTRGVEGLNITTKELIPIVIAIALWGRELDRPGCAVPMR